MSGEIVIPGELLTHVKRYWGERGRQWTLALPEIIAEICGAWTLRLGDTFSEASTAFVAAVTQGDGSDAVLKVAFPDIVGEADALAAYRGSGAVSLYAYDRERCALLLERCHPGTTLRALNDPQAILATTCTLMQRLWRTTAPLSIPTLADHCAHLADLGRAVLAGIEDHLGGDGSDGPQLDAATRAFAHEGLDLLAGSAEGGPAECLLHGDLHPGNIRRSTREPWLVIDPKPLRGDPAYEPIPLIIETPSANGVPPDNNELVTRVGIVAKRLDLSPLRIASWGRARRIDWALFCLGRLDLAGASRPFAEAHWFGEAELYYAND